jgi:hypothetical protein
MAKPEKLFVDMYPFSPSYPTPRFEDFDYLRYTFQECATLDPSFWYQAQGFGQTRNGVPDIWRFPDSSELKASVMLALAHGSKGILFSTYDSWWTVDYLNGTDIIYIHGLVDTLNGTIPVTDLWYMIRDNLAPRLKGKLGNTLMNLDYTGNYINNECSSCGIHDNPSLDYLEIDCNVSSYFWHCGFFTHKDYPDNKHFLLTNLRTTVPVSTDLIVSNNTGYENVCFKDI